MMEKLFTTKCWWTLSSLIRRKKIQLVFLCLIAGLFVFNYALAADGSGTNAVVPTTVKSGTTGNTFNFTYTAAETMDSGGISITVPAGWSAPQGNSGTAGYTTVTSASGIIANVVNALDATTNWTATQHMALSADTGDKQEGTASLVNTISATAAAGEQWYFNYGAAANWGDANVINLRVGFWIKSSVALAAGDLQWQDDDTASLASPLDTINIPAIPANTWTYTSVTLGAATRTSILSYGFKYAVDVGAATIKIDSIAPLFDAADSLTNWKSDGSITRSLLNTAGNFKEGAAAIRCAYAAGAGIGVNGQCYSNNGKFVIGPGGTVSFWARSSIALNAGDFVWKDDDSKDFGSPLDTVNIPALSANTWTYVTLSAPNSSNITQLSYGLERVVNTGAVNFDIDAMGKQIDACDASTGWTAPTASVQTLSADTTTFHENGASLKNIITAAAAAGDNWYETFASPQNWSGYTTAGFWIRSTVATTAGQLKFEYSSASDLTSPIASINIGALSADTWTYQKLTLTGTRTSVSSFGISYATDIGAATVNLDDILIGPGSLTFPGGGVINARILSLANTQTAVISYGSGGGASGVTASGTAGTNTFTTKSRASDSGTLTNIASSPTVQVTASKFVIINPTDGTVDAPITVTVEAQDALGGIDTSYQNDVTLVVSGSATGGGLVNIVNGVGTINISDTVAETVNLSLSDTQSTGLNVSSTQDVIFAPGAVAQFTLNDPGNMTAGTRLGYTVTRKDQFNNLMTSGTTTVYLYSSSTGANKKFYDAASGGNIITSIAISGGSSSANFWYYDEAPGTWTITASDNSSAPDGTTGIDDATDSVTVTIVPATKFVIINPTDGTVDAPITVTVEAQNDSGAVDTSYQNDVTLVTSGSATGGGLVNIVNGVGTLNISDTVAETVNLSLSDTESTGLDVSSAQDVVFAPGATAQFTLDDPGNMTAGTRLGYTVTRKDQFNNLVTPGSNTVYLYSSSTGVNKKFYDAASGGNIITSINITAGNSSANFWYYDEAPGTWTITASDNSSAPDGTTGIDDATDSVVVSPAATAQFTLNDPGDMTAGTRLGYTVTRKDAFNNLVTSGSTTVHLYSSSTGANKKFYDAASGGNIITSIVITNGNSSANFWYYDELAGTFTITASDNSSAPDGAAGIADATDSVTVSPAATAQLSLNDPGNMTAGTRLGYTVTRKDQFNNLVTSGSTTVYLYSSSTGANKKFYDAASGGNIITSINITAGNSLADFWYYDELAGTWTITASDNASAPDGATGIADATDNMTVNAATTAQFTLDDPGNMTAGTRLGYTVTRKDQFNNLVTSGTTTVYLYSSSTGSNKAFYSVSSGGSPIISINITAGNSSVNFWYYDDAVGTWTITASDNSSAPDGAAGIADATDSVTVNTAAISQFTLNHPGSITAGTRAAYTVTRKDSFGNLITSGSNTVYLYSSSAGANKKFYDAASGGNIITSIDITNGNSSANFWYYDEAPGTWTITASDNATAPDGNTGIDDATDSLTVNAAATSQFILNDPGDMAAGTRLGYTVTRKDAFNNLVTSGSNTVYLYSSSTGANKKFYDAASGGNIIISIDITDGNSSASFWYYDELTSAFTITASDNSSAPDGATGIADATDSVIVSPAATAQFTLNDPGDMTAGTRLGYTVTRKDQFNNLVTSGSTTVYLYSSSTGANKKFYDAASGGNIITFINITAGNSTANFWYYDELAGAFTITVSDNASAPDGATGIDDAADSVAVCATAISQFTLNHPGSIIVGNRAAYTVTRKDAFGNLTTSGFNTVYLYSSSTGVNKKFYDAASGGNIITSVSITNGNSSADFWYYDDLAGTWTITASDNATAPDGATGIADATDSLAVSAAATKFVIINPTDGTVDAPITVTVQAQDNFNNVDTSYQNDVTLVTSGSATGGGLVNIVNGVGTLNISDTVAETVNLSLSDTQSTGLNVSSTQDVIFAPGAVAQFTLNDPGDMAAGTRLGYTVTRKDQFNNLVTSGSNTIYLYSSSAGANKKFYDAASGGNIIASIDITNGNSSANFWYYDELAGTFTITVSDNATAPDGTTGIDDATDSVIVSSAATSQFMLNDPGNMTAGTRLGYTVTRKDQFNNLVTSGSNTVYLYSSSTGVNKKFYDAASGGNIITSINITAGNSSANFWYYDEAPGTWTITASDNATAPDGATGIDDATDSVTVSTASVVATKFVIINPTDGTVDNPITVTVEAQDNAGNVATSTQSDVTLVTSGSATGGGLVNIVNGVGTLNISDTVAETVNLSLSDTEGTGLNVVSTQDVVFAPGATAQFALNNPGDMTAGTRLGYAVTRKDQFSNLVISGSTAVYLYSSSTSTNKAFYNASSGGSPIISINITAGNSSANFWYYDDAAGTWTITASDNASAPDGNTGIDDATDSVVVTAAPIVATRFVILNPADSTAGTATIVTVQAQDGSGNVQTTYQNDVTLVASGSATGAGLVNIINGSGTKSINDAVAETVNLSLSDTESTGLDVSSAQDVVFSAVPVTTASTPAPTPTFMTIIRFFGRAYPDAQVTLLAKNGDQEIPLQYTPVVSRNGDFGLEFTGKIFGYKSYGFRITDKDGRSTPARFYNLDVNLYSITETNVFAPPTIGLARQVAGKNDKLSIAGYATPGINVELELDGKILDNVVISDSYGYYAHQLDISKLDLGEHQLRARQHDNRIGQASDWSILTLFAVSSMVAPQTDLNNDGIIDISDYSIFLTLWNNRASPQAKIIDFNGDGKIDISDFSLFMAAVK